MNVILNNIFKGIFLYVLCVIFNTFPLNFKPSLRHFSPSHWCRTSLVTLLHVCQPALDRSSLHRAEPNLIGSSSWQAEQEFGIVKDKSSPTPSPHGLHGSGAPTSPLGHFINPTLVASQVMTSVSITALLLLQADVHHAELLQHLG